MLLAQHCADIFRFYICIHARARLKVLYDTGKYMNHVYYPQGKLHCSPHCMFIYVSRDVDKKERINLGFVGPCIFTHSNESTNQIQQLITGLLLVV
jgi:hypothetical protein